MTAVASKLPSDARPLKLDPDLAAFLEAQLAPLAGKDLAKAQQAIVKVRKAGATGTWDALTQRYATAIEEAVTAP